MFIHTTENGKRIFDVLLSVTLQRMFKVAVVKEDGYNFFFYSNEHEPIHVHVRSGSGKAKFDVTDEVQLLESKGMKVPELRKAQELAEENVETIRSKWHEFFG